MLSTLLVYAMVLPLDSIAAEEKEENSTTHAIIMLEEDSEVPVFASDDSESNILIYLTTNDPITIIKTDDPFTLIEFEDVDGQSQQGYVENEPYRLVEEQEQALDDADGLDKNNTDNKEADTGEKVDKGIYEEPNSEVAQIDQTTYKGIALNVQTNVYAKDSKDAKVLKSYSIGSILTYQSWSKNWYSATVIIKGKRVHGYIHMDDVDTIDSAQKSLQGISTKSPTTVYQKASTNSKELKTYAAGTLLKYKTFSDKWYQATVIIKGKKTTGYIHKNDTENISTKQQKFRGIAVQPTAVYQKASTSAKKYKSYTKGTILKYRSLSKNWYEATIYIKGKKTIGYIHAKDVENVEPKQESMRGVSIQTTPIYQKASTSSKMLKSYTKGTVLKYKTFTTNWYEATIYMKGKKTTGYIHANDVENVEVIQKDLQGVTMKEKGTSVYSKPITSSKVLKKYPYGAFLKYKSFTKDWFEATIILHGKKTKAYIKKSDVRDMNYQLSGFAQKNPTHIYEDAKRSSKTLKTYSRGAQLKYRPYNKDWYVVTFNVNGDWKNGYLHTNDVHVEMLDLIYKTKYYDFKEMADRQAKKKPTTDGKGKIQATRGEIDFYTNPANFPKTSDEYFQFLVLSAPAGLDAAQVNHKILKGKGSLEGTAQAFINAGKIYNINEAYLIAHALHETGNGKSSLAQGLPVDKTGRVTKDKNGKIAKTKDTKHTVYNMFGYGAKDACPIECGAQYAFDNGWFTIEQSIYGGIESIHTYIARGQNTLYKMRWNPDGGLTPPAIPEWYQYATHTQWAVIQTRRIAEIYSLMDEYVVEMDIPTFTNTPNTGTTTPKSLDIKSKVDKNSTTLGTIPKGSQVKITGSNVNAWYKVTYKGKTGWVEAKHVKLNFK